MKNLQRFSLLLLAAAVLVMGVHWFWHPLPDWAVRADGAGMLAALFLVSFATASGVLKR